jgi:hypothetical protein
MGTDAQDADAKVLERLAAGDTRRAVHAARDLVERQAAGRRVSDPAGAALLDAALAGVLVEIAEALPARKPPKVPGYDGGPPSADHLLAAYRNARTGTRRR